MSTLIATLPPSFSDMNATASPAAGRSDLSDFSFHDLLSIVNPLQHVPIVATLYRAVTGDTIKPLERIAGDTLYGGVWGFISSVANVAFQEITGKDFGDTALALLEGDQGDQPVGVAAATLSASATATVTPAVAPQLAATAPPIVLQRPAVTAPPDATAALALMMAAGTGDSALSQRATTAYGKALALPVDYSTDLVPIY